ncbi:MAG: radical SAM domain-containing protein [Acidobacteria bacterium]|nr:radical SAM domain-containing protein [Acidobacteriota bacterium]
MSRWRKIGEVTRPVSREMARALADRWRELPEHVKTPAQVLGRFGLGCEGTHGVFPRCNFSCTPCYHSSDANRVRVDGEHTVRHVDAQMEFLAQRAPHAHAQLIGGEVTLLDPDDHARTLQSMRRWGREPMSFSHGDFDYEYLERLTHDAQGRRRLRRISFAVHLDTTMRGRRGLRRTDDERALTPYRAAVMANFRRLRREKKVSSFVAHNMTVTPANVDQIVDVVRESQGFGFGMYSFQPAAFVGDRRRWREDYSTLDADRIWSKIEEGAGSPLPYRVLQVGDLRCNRTAWGFYVGDQWTSFFDENDPRDLEARDALLRDLGGVHFSAPPFLLVLRLSRVVLRHPTLILTAGSWTVRTVRRAGGWKKLLRERPRITTFVMHRFMDAEEVGPAWRDLQDGTWADVPERREVHERLLACSYRMAHPETGQLVPACVQHGLLDPEENRHLANELPLPRRRVKESLER